MRILLTTAPGAGHLFPVVPLGWALRSAGHDVLLATAGPGVTLGPAAGLSTVDAAPGVDVDEVIAQAVRESGGFAASDPEQARARAIRLFGAASGVMLDGMRRCADAWRPDAVVYENLCGAGAVLAAERGVPGVVQSLGWAAPPDAMVSAMWPLLGSGEPVPSSVSIGITPESLGPAQHWASPRRNVWDLRMRPVPYGGGAVVADDVLAAPQRPRVLLTMGTVAPRFGGFDLLRDLVAALAAEPVELLVALGGDPAVLGEVPANVRVHPWVPLSAAVHRCSAVVHHGGAGTSLASAAAGVGQVVLPQGADQFLNADSLAARGCAVRGTPDPGGVRAAVRDVVAGTLQDGVAGLADEIAAMPPPSAVAAELITGLA